MVRGWILSLNKQNRFISRIFSYSLVGIFALSGFSCGNLSIRRGDAVPGVKTLDVDSATIENPLELSVVDGYLGSLATGTGVAQGCTLGVGNSANASLSVQDTEVDDGALLTINQALQGQAFSTAAQTWMRIRQVKVHLYEVGNPGGTLTPMIRTATGVLPDTATTALLGTGTAFTQTSVDGDNPGGSGNLYTMNFSTPVDILPGVYALVLQASQANVANYISWITSDGTAAACSGHLNYTRNTGSGFAAVAGKRSLYQIIADTHPASTSATWILAAYSNAVWDLSTFEAEENPDGTGGLLTYDLGAGTSPDTATYTHEGLSLAQVQAAADLVGEFLYVRANFTVASPFFDRAVLGDIAIESK